MERENVRKAAIRYGMKIMECVLYWLEREERFEDCAILIECCESIYGQKLMRYEGDYQKWADDYVYELNKLGLKGETAYFNARFYFLDALLMMEIINAKEFTYLSIFNQQNER